jgi:hypothetical protein
MAAHITYLSEAALHAKFGRNLQDRDARTFSFNADFQVESYLRHQGSTFVDRFDANSYLYITRAMDYFDLAGEFDGVLANAFQGTKVRFCVVSFTSDWLYPTHESRKIVQALNAVAANVSFVEVESDKGHDAFLLEEPARRRRCPTSGTTRPTSISAASTTSARSAATWACGSSGAIVLNSKSRRIQMPPLLANLIGEQAVFMLRRGLEAFASIRAIRHRGRAGGCRIPSPACRRFRRHPSASAVAGLAGGIDREAVVAQRHALPRNVTRRDDALGEKESSLLAR